MTKKKTVAKKAKSAKKKSAGKSNASTKKPAKKKTSKKTGKVMTGGDADTQTMDPLRDRLKGHVQTALIAWQVGFGHDGFRQMMLGMLNPAADRSDLMIETAARTTAFHSFIKDAKDAGETFPWVVPWVGAVSFEAMFQACAGFWLVAGDPPNQGTLRSSVEEFVDFQVSIFCTTVGANT